MQLTASLAAFSTVWLAWSATASAEGPLWLVREGKPQCTIVRGQEDDFAAERLQRWFAENSGAQVEAVLADSQAPTQPGCLILLGSAASNPAVGKIAGELRIDIDPKTLTGQGYVARRVRHAKRDYVLLAGGGRDGTIYAVADLMNWTLRRDGRDASLGALDTRQVPRMQYRWFWNWDHRMDWGGPGRVGNVMGGGGTFSKKPEAFLIDFKHCVDYMADHKFNGLILWGFVRDTHGGIEASQELCRYARHRGVRILPGVGTSDYGGYYFEGNHLYNADTWLAKHPELRSINRDGTPRNSACPTKRENQQWLDAGAKWLFDTFEIGGVNLEMGDFYVCYCEGCKKARAAIQSNEPDYYKDMAISHMVTFKTMRRLAPEAWLSYATYTGYDAKMLQSPPKFLEMIPEDTICQWTLTGMASRWASLAPMAKHNLGYLHWCNSSTHTEDAFYLQSVRDICRNAASVGFEGLDTYGELSSERPNVELFYLAWEAFLWNPEMTIDQFVDQRLSRLYGGVEPARTMVKIALSLEASNGFALENLAELGRFAATARETSNADGRSRWDRLIAYLDRHQEAARQKREQSRRAEAEARRGQKVEVISARASDEDARRGWSAAKAVDGSVQEPEGYWLTQSNSPKQAWLELSLARPAKVNRVAIFHQLDARHYRSRDYTVSVRAGDQWKPVVQVKDQKQSGWVGHPFDTVETDAVRLEITRSYYGSRMGVGEIELRMEKE